jgi:putative DNA primase/helicase
LNGTAPTVEKPPAAKEPPVQVDEIEEEGEVEDQEDFEEQEDNSFTLNSQGVFHTHYERDKSSNTLRPVTVNVCSPRLEVVACARDPNSEAWGLLMKWTDADKVEHSWVCPAHMLVGDGVSLRETLADGGLRFGNAPKERFAQYLRSRRPQRRITCVPQVGWLERCFITPLWIIPSGADVGYQSAGRGEHYYRVSGTLAEWRDNVSKPCAGNSRLVFAISAAFAGPILRPLNVQGGGFHYRSFSSFGKSTAQLAAGSVWGGGGRLGWARSWSATKNAFESIAELHNDGFLALDEIQLMNPRELQESIYMLSNGFGKGRETRNMTGRRTLQWLCMVLSNGERPIADMVAEAGKKIRGGADIRLATIPADAGAGMGIFEKLPEGITDARIFAETLEAAAKAYFGTAIQAFIEAWRGDWDRFVQESNQFIEDFIEHNLPTRAAPEVRRVLRRFAVVACAGETATEMGLTGWEEGEAAAAAIACFEAWIQERGGAEGTDIRNAVEQIRECLATQHARFRSAEPKKRQVYSKDGKALKTEEGEPVMATIEERIPDQLGYWKHIHGELVYLIDPGKFQTEVCPGYHAPDIAIHLKSKNLLVHGEGRLQAKARVTLPNGDTEVQRFYAVKAKILEVEAGAEDVF